MVTENNIIEASNFIVRYACEETSSGMYIVYVEEIAQEISMTSEEIRNHNEDILNEMYKRCEIVEARFCTEEDYFDVDCILDFCPQYQWIDGDEDIFNCSKEEWLEMPVEEIVDAPLK